MCLGATGVKLKDHWNSVGAYPGATITVSTWVHIPLLLDECELLDLKCLCLLFTPRLTVRQMDVWRGRSVWPKVWSFSLFFFSQVSLLFLNIIERYSVHDAGFLLPTNKRNLIHKVLVCFFLLLLGLFSVYCLMFFPFLTGYFNNQQWRERCWSIVIWVEIGG
jgi:hypothetical protein